MKKILIILGHPNKATYCGFLALAYQQASENSGYEVRCINLGDLSFDPILHKGYLEIQELEDDLNKAQEDIYWADHLVWIFPIWWGDMPALLKGFVDRIFLPGFAFKFKKDSNRWDKLLVGKSARIIMTMYGSKIFYKLIGAPGERALKNAVLKFCGIESVKITIIDQIKNLKKENLEKQIRQIEKLGKKAK